jgi:hypothetical protein
VTWHVNMSVSRADNHCVGHDAHTKPPYLLTIPMLSENMYSLPSRGDV